MGCCVSTEGVEQGGIQEGKSVANRHGITSRAPPACIEEETVKEVLSETSKPSIPSPVSRRPISKFSHLDDAAAKTVAQKGDSGCNDFLQDDCYSENTASELSSSTITHDLSYDEERDRVKMGRRRVPARARPEWNAGPGKERAMGRSPTRRSEHSSPARRGVAGGGSVRMVTGKDHLPMSGQTRIRRKGLKFEGGEKEGGGPLERRSRSPAANRSAAGNRSSNPRRVSQSPARAREAEQGKSLLNSSDINGGSEGNDNDSLDNPLVSLECFIFL